MCPQLLPGLAPLVPLGPPLGHRVELAQRLAAQVLPTERARVATWVELNSNVYKDITFARLSTVANFKVL